MKIPFVDLHTQYLSIKQEIDRAIADVIAQSACISLTACGRLRGGMGEKRHH
jgi:hypothetical protein